MFTKHVDELPLAGNILWNLWIILWHLNLGQLFTFDQGWNEILASNLSLLNLSTDFDQAFSLHIRSTQRRRKKTHFDSNLNFIEKKKLFGFVSRCQITYLGKPTAVLLPPHRTALVTLQNIPFHWTFLVFFEFYFNFIAL